MKKVAAVLLVMVCTWGASAWAEMPPQELVRDTAEKMIAKLKEEKEVVAAEPGRIYELVNAIVLPHFDFEYMSRSVLAKYWRRATAEQRASFVNEFRTLLVRTYATSLSEYTDETIHYLPFRGKADDTEVTVRTEVEQPGAFPIPIDYRLHRKEDQWLVFDVLIDDVSLVTNYQTSFANEIRKSGLDDFISTLAQRNKQVTGG